MGLIVLFWGGISIKITPEISITYLKHMKCLKPSQALRVELFSSTEVSDPCVCNSLYSAVASE